MLIKTSDLQQSLTTYNSIKLLIDKAQIPIELTLTSVKELLTHYESIDATEQTNGDLFLKLISNKPHHKPLLPKQRILSYVSASPTGVTQSVLNQALWRIGNKFEIQAFLQELILENKIEMGIEESLEEGKPGRKAILYRIKQNGATTAEQSPFSNNKGGN